MPFLLFVGLGLWLWQGGAGLLPTPRQVIWELPRDREALRGVELQVWDGEVLLKREELSFSSPPPPRLVQQVALKRGRYLGRVFLKSDGAPVRSESIELVVEGEPNVTAALRR